MQPRPDGELSAGAPVSGTRVLFVLYLAVPLLVLVGILWVGCSHG
jgi:hypothetical protein